MLDKRKLVSKELTIDEQEWILKNLPPTPDNQQEEGVNTKIVSVSGSVNGIGKLQRNEVETLSKKSAILKLKSCNWKTPPREVASYLEIIFGVWKENPDIWLTISQFHHPKCINGVINQMIKQHRRGDKIIKKPANYFVIAIKKKNNRRNMPKRRQV